MGLMACSRTDCDQILCHTYVNGIGYICYECQDEFKHYLARKDNYPTTQREIERELEAFMETRKGEHEESIKMSVDDFFKSHSDRY